MFHQKETLWLRLQALLSYLELEAGRIVTSALSLPPSSQLTALPGHNISNSEGGGGGGSGMGKRSLGLFSRVTELFQQTAQAGSRAIKQGGQLAEHGGSKQQARQLQLQQREVHRCVCVFWGHGC